jgi:hypothetical protein
MLLLTHGAEIVTVHHASAQAVNTTQTFINGFTSIGIFFITIFNFFAWLTLFFLHHFIDPKFIFGLNEDGSDGALMQHLHNIWQFTRDIVNIGFALGLIAGAVMMVIKADSSAIKEKLPKFLMALVIVNFSWFIPRALFDLSQVLTYTAYQIPSLLNMDGCTLPPGPDSTEPRPCMVVTDFKFLREQTQTIVEGEDGWQCPLPPLVCVQYKPIDQADSVQTPARILDGLVANHARLRWLADISFREEIPPGTPLTETVQRMMTIVIRLVLVLVLHIAILFPLVAMLFAFLIRIPILWMTIAFMPAVALGYVFEPLKEYVDEIQKEFLQAVFLPAKVAIPFAVSFVMLNIGAQIPTPTEFGGVESLPIFSGIRGLWQMVWLLMSLGILWHYSFKMLSSDKAGLAGMFTDTIQGLGKQLGEFAYKLPLSIPFIPAGIDPGTGQARTQSPLQLLHAGQNILSSVNRLGVFPGTNPHGTATPTTTPTTPPDPALKPLVDALQQGQRTGSVVPNTITVNMNQVTGAGTAAEQNKLLTQHLEDLVRVNTGLRNHTQRQIIDALASANLITPAVRDQLRPIADRAGTGGVNP